MGDINVENSGTPEPDEQTSDEFVEIPDATDTELEQFLLSESEEDSESEETTPDRAQRPEKTETEKATPAPNAPQPQPPVNLAEENAKLQKRIEDQKRFLDRQSTEIGQARQQISEYKARLEAHAAEIADTDPREAAKLDRKIENANSKLEELDAELASNQNAVQTAELFRAAGVDKDYDPAAVTQSLIEDGMDPEYAAAVAQNPAAYTEAPMALQLAKRARAEKVIRLIVPAMKTLHDENQELKRQLQEKGVQVINGVKKALKSSPPVTAAAGAPKARNANLEMSMADMSDAELDEFMKQGTGKNGKNSVFDE